MKKLSALFLIYAIMVSPPSMADLSHRTGFQLGGIFLVMGYGVSLGAIYQMAFHRNLALEVNGNYNFGALALGQGPAYSGGLDISLQMMLYNFGDRNFSKGFGLGLGSGVHYLADFNENLYSERSGDRYLTSKGTFLLFPVNMEFFYQHLFDNNWFIKTGVKGYLTQPGYQLGGPRINVNNAARILPSLYFDLGYSF